MRIIRGDNHQEAKGRNDSSEKNVNPVLGEVIRAGGVQIFVASCRLITQSASYPFDNNAVSAFFRRSFSFATKSR